MIYVAMLQTAIHRTCTGSMCVVCFIARSHGYLRASHVRLHRSRVQASRALLYRPPPCDAAQSASPRQPTVPRSRHAVRSAQPASTCHFRNTYRDQIFCHSSIGSPQRLSFIEISASTLHDPPCMYSHEASTQRLFAKHTLAATLLRTSLKNVIAQLRNYSTLYDSSTAS